MNWLKRRYWNVRNRLWSGFSWTVKIWRRKYLTIKMTGHYDLPPDAMSRAMDMYFGKRPGDADLLARLWMRDTIRHNERMSQITAQQRVLERKIQAQRAELNRLRKPRSETA